MGPSSNIGLIDQVDFTVNIHRINFVTKIDKKHFTIKNRASKFDREKIVRANFTINGSLETHYSQIPRLSKFIKLSFNNY